MWSVLRVEWRLVICEHMHVLCPHVSVLSIYVYSSSMKPLVPHQTTDQAREERFALCPTKHPTFRQTLYEPPGGPAKPYPSCCKPDHPLHEDQIVWRPLFLPIRVHPRLPSPMLRFEQCFGRQGEGL